MSLNTDFKAAEVEFEKHYLEHSVGGLTPRGNGLNNKKGPVSKWILFYS